MTSQKKRDKMPIYTNTTASTPVGATTYAVQPAYLNGSTDYIIPWVATARTMEASNAGGIPSSAFESARTSTTCFMRGIKEVVQIQTNSGASWMWRRVCFTMKGSYLYSFATTTGKLAEVTSNGWMRIVNSVKGTPLGDQMLNRLFEGYLKRDWEGDPFTASLDRSRVTVMYDKTRVIQSGNSNGVQRNYKIWHPMNKNLVYDDEQAGGSEDMSYYSTFAKPGMGDYYVVDFFRAGNAASATDQLQLGVDSMLYWHEK